MASEGGQDPVFQEHGNYEIRQTDGQQSLLDDTKPAINDKKVTNDSTNEPTKAESSRSSARSRKNENKPPTPQEQVLNGSTNEQMPVPSNGSSARSRKYDDKPPTPKAQEIIDATNETKESPSNRSSARSRKNDDKPPTPKAQEIIDATNETKESPSNRSSARSRMNENLSSTHPTKVDSTKEMAVLSNRSSARSCKTDEKPPISQTQNDVVVQQCDEKMQKSGANTTCVMCKKTLQNPRMLPCLHSICFTCLDNMLDINKTSEHFSCPECDEATTTLSPEFISNVYLEGILSIHKTKTGEPQDCEVCLLKNQKTEAVYECLDCIDLLCETCGNAHSSTRATVDHRVILLSELASGKYDAEIRKKTRVQCRHHSGEVFDQFCLKCNTMVCRECRITGHLSHEFLSIEDAHKTKETEVLNKSEKVVKKQRQFSERENKFDVILRDIDSNEKTLTTYLDKTTSALVEKIMHEKQRTLMKLQHYMKHRRAECTEKKTEVQSELQRMSSGVRICGDVVRNGKPDEVIFLSPAMTRRLHQLATLPLTSDGDTEIEFPTITLRDEFSDMDYLQVFDFVPDLPDDFPTPRAPNSERSSVSIQLIEKITVSSPTDYQNPKITGIACLSDGKIVVSDSGNSNVKIYSQKGLFLSTLLTCKPVNMVSCQNILAITDRFSVQLISTDKKFKKRLPQDGNGSLFAMTAVQNKYFALLGAHSSMLKIYDTKGQFIQELPVAKTRKKVIQRQPMYLTSNSKGELIFSDWGTNSVVHMSSAGEVLHEYRCDSISRYNHGWMPGGVCVDEFDNVFVANQQNNEILILNSKLRPVNKRRTQRDDLERPVTMSSDGRGRIYVSGKGGIINVYALKYSNRN